MQRPNMTIEYFIQKANEAYANSEFELALNCLKEAGALGDLNAALDFSYKTSSKDPKGVVDYLSAIPAGNRPIAQYHQLLIGYFGSVYRSSSYVVERLIALSKEGVVEASLTLMAYVPENTPEFSWLASILQKRSPNIYNQLKIDNFVDNRAIELDQNAITEFIISRFDSFSIESNVIDDKTSVVLYENVLTAFECNYMITRFSPMLEPSMVVDPLTGKGRVDSVRTSYIATIFPEVADWITRKIDHTIAQLTSTKVTQGEALSLLRYQPGQEYKPHYDALSVGEDAEIFQDGGQRIKTALIYLNSLTKEGCTLFPKLGIRVQPALGSMLVFSNVDDDGKTLLNSYHAGEKLITKDKWLVTKWIRKYTTNYGSFIYGN